MKIFLFAAAAFVVVYSQSPPTWPTTTTEQSPDDNSTIPQWSFRGSIDPSIIMGQRVQNGEIPYQALLITFVGNDPFICGGSLIHENWVLTAAHCINEGSTESYVLMGGVQINSMPYQARALARIPHEDYNAANNFINDIALFKIPSADPSLGLSLVTLAPADVADFSDQSARASGFGFITNQGPTSEELLKVNLRTLSNAECRAYWGQSRIADSNVCAYWLTQEGEAVCSGDSGGPLVLNEQGNNIQVGLVSFGLASGCSNAPQVFTRVSSYRQWITNTMNSN